MISSAVRIEDARGPDMDRGPPFEDPCSHTLAEFFMVKLFPPFYYLIVHTLPTFSSLFINHVHSFTHATSFSLSHLPSQPLNPSSTSSNFDVYPNNILLLSPPCKSVSTACILLVIPLMRAHWFLPYTPGGQAPLHNKTSLHLRTHVFLPSSVSPEHHQVSYLSELFHKVAQTPITGSIFTHFFLFLFHHVSFLLSEWIYNGLLRVNNGSSFSVLFYVLVKVLRI